MIRVAMPIEDDRLCEHFGHAPKFAFFDIEDGKVTSTQIEPSPEHYEGSFPQWIKEKGADAVIVAGIGPKAKELFESFGIKVISNAIPKDARELIEDFIANRLDLSYQEVCDHEHHHGHHH
ncbi:NifB/NifX family molybdenum-iron cluster-binding protein [Hippea maritima]|uniref:Dinitrogenase iron-molybdenum cofactor biosynthesis protein n=1 Tax=Hippea maritima (strain ATCC 700847 / DSM 10411 / MH2) TaxID=760142 RepID=F2LUF0_HIPMA|nr:NifB/NifX family molybdenum-iron cluster-binding protein [Hippea maritima]AEA33476.1 Dinitrogenase iron-molybdenum cofactor biosynthesis protein [Hippea maritima DSM 10411]